MPNTSILEVYELQQQKTTSISTRVAKNVNLRLSGAQTQLNWTVEDLEEPGLSYFSIVLCQIILMYEYV